LVSLAEGIADEKSRRTARKAQHLAEAKGGDRHVEHRSVKSAKKNGARMCALTITLSRGFVPHNAVPPAMGL
jgi:hypothetical protein